MRVVYLLLPLVVATSVWGQQLPAWGSLRPGPLAVGVAAWVSHDSTSSDRAVQLVVWYPATRRAGERSLTYRDYVALTGAERGDTSAAAADRAVAGFLEFLGGAGLVRADIDPWLASSMLAARDAPRDRQRYPLVLLSQGNFHAAYNQAVLAEYLASHGFVVATTPSVGRIGPQMQSEDDIYAVASAQAADLDFARRQLIRQRWADSTRVATVGHSFGARASLLLLAEKRATLLVSLDGGIANKQGPRWLERSPVDPAAITGSIVHVYQESDSIVQPEFSLVRSMTATDRWLVRADSLRHWQFTSFGTIAASYPGLRQSPTGPLATATAARLPVVVGCVLRHWANGDVPLITDCLTGPSGLSGVQHLAPAR